MRAANTHILRCVEPTPHPGVACSRPDTQPCVPSARWPTAQLAFKNSMVREILQFTPSIAFRYVLHRGRSQDIHCRESFIFEHVTSGRSTPFYTNYNDLGTTRANTAASLCPRPGNTRLLRQHLLSVTRGPNPRRSTAAASSAPSHIHRKWLVQCTNDPSAGSPTETLLRLLLPLNDKVQ